MIPCCFCLMILSQHLTLLSSRMTRIDKIYKVVVREVEIVRMYKSAVPKIKKQKSKSPSHTNTEYSQLKSAFHAER